MGGMTD